MHVVTLHEIVFSFTFAWPLAVLLSMLMLRVGKAPPRPLFWFAILAGPVAALVFLSVFVARAWRDDAEGRGAEAIVYRPDGLQRRLDRWLLASLIAASAAGILTLVLRGRAMPCLWASRVHAALAVVLGLAFAAYAYRHVRALSSPAVAALTILLGGILVSTMYPARTLFMAVSGVIVLSYRWAARNWRIAVDPYRESDRRNNSDAVRTALIWILGAGSTLALLTGLAIFAHPGWTRAYYLLIKAHSHIGYAVWVAFFVYLYQHVRQYADRRAATEMLALAGLITAPMLTLNYIVSPGLALNVPIFALIFWLSNRLARRLAPLSGDDNYRAGMAVMAVAALTLSSGAYIAEPLNSWLNNNMGLYVVYAHGAGALLLLPWLLGAAIHHVWPRISPTGRLQMRRATAGCIPAFVALFLVGSVWGHWKWFGLDAGAHYWPPDVLTRLYTRAKQARVTYVTYNGAPPAPADGAYPAEFDAVFRRLHGLLGEGLPRRTGRRVEGLHAPVLGLQPVLPQGHRTDAGGTGVRPGELFLRELP